MNKKEKKLTTTKIYEDTLDRVRKFTDKNDITLYKFLSNAADEKLQRDSIKELEKIR